MVRSYGDEERAYQLGRGREYHSSDENIDETFMNEYASSESSISVYGKLLLQYSHVSQLCYVVCRTRLFSVRADGDLAEVQEHGTSPEADGREMERWRQHHSGGR